MVKHKNSGKTGREQCEIGDKIGQKTVILKQMACGGKESPFLNAIIRCSNNRAHPLLLSQTHLFDLVIGYPMRYDFKQ